MAALTAFTILIRFGGEMAALTATPPLVKGMLLRY